MCNDGELILLCNSPAYSIFFLTVWNCNRIALASLVFILRVDTNTAKIPRLKLSQILNGVFRGDERQEERRVVMFLY